MAPDFHVFLPADNRPVRVEQEGIEAKMEFATLGEATRHLRDRGTGFVVIHDQDEQSANRIPLAWAG
jgi:hypothetical protein